MFGQTVQKVTNCESICGDGDWKRKFNWITVISDDCKAISDWYSMQFLTAPKRSISIQVEIFLIVKFIISINVYLNDIKLYSPSDDCKI